MEELKKIIDAAYEGRHQLTPASAPNQTRDAVAECIRALDQGRARVAENKDGRWIVNEWLKKAVLLYFRLEENQVLHGDFTNFFDRVPAKFHGFDRERFASVGARVVPPATVRFGSYIAPNVVLMPSYVNIGAYVDSGTMVDTWATVGSCAQIGKDVHLSGGVGIGGARTAAIRPYHYRRLLLHRGSIRDRRRCDRRRGFGDLDGCLYRAEHQDL